MAVSHDGTNALIINVFQDNRFVSLNRRFQVQCINTRAVKAPLKITLPKYNFVFPKTVTFNIITFLMLGLGSGRGVGQEHQKSRYFVDSRLVLLLVSKHSGLPGR